MSTPRNSDRLRRMQRYGLVLMFVIGALNYMDRGTLSVANPFIRRDLGLTIAEMGLLLSAFLWPYAFFLLPSGGLIDRFGARRVVFASLVVWSIAQATAGFVLNLAQFMVARAVLGVGEAPTFPAFSRAVRDWYHPRNQAFAVGVWNSSASFGNALALPVLTALMLGFGWRWMFVFMGVIGILLSLAWLGVFRDRAEVSLSHDEVLALADGQEEAEILRPSFAAWRRLFQFRTTWGLIFGCFGINYIGWLFIAWLPGYLEMQRHISIARTGMIGSIPYISAFAGSIIGGIIAGKLLSGGLTAINSRKFPTAVGAAVMGLATLIAAGASGDATALVAISLAMFFGISAMGTSWSLTMACVPPQYVGSLGSIMDFGGFVGAALAPMVTGFVVQATGSFTPALLVAGVIGLLSAAAYQFLIPNRAIQANELHLAMYGVPQLHT